MVNEYKLEIEEQIKKLKAKRAILTIKAKIYLNMLQEMLPIDEPLIAEEAKELWKELDKIMKGSQNTDSIFRIMEREQELKEMLRGE